MSVNITASSVAIPYEDDDDHSQGSGQSEEDNKELENFDDWIDEEGQKTKSLFDDTFLDSANACIAYDKEHHQFDLLGTSSKLGALYKRWMRYSSRLLLVPGLDFLQRIKLINYIRKEVRLLRRLSSTYRGLNSFLPAPGTFCIRDSYAGTCSILR